MKKIIILAPLMLLLATAAWLYGQTPSAITLRQPHPEVPVIDTSTPVVLVPPTHCEHVDVSEVPVTIRPLQLDNVIRNPATGVGYIQADELLLKFSTAPTPEILSGISCEYALTFVGQLVPIGLWQVRSNFPLRDEQLMRLRDKLILRPDVEFVEFNIVISTFF